jgi:hypothetical protein
VILRACVSPEPLSLDDGETTDKGYTNSGGCWSGARPLFGDAAHYGFDP